MFVYYANDPYISFDRVAREYRRLIAGNHTLVRDPRRAEVFFFLGAPGNGVRLLENRPELRDTYAVGYFVCEADRLSPAVVRAVRRFDEVWTPSRYCEAVFRKYHPRVVRVPHAIHRDLACSAADRAYAKKVTRRAPDDVVFLTVTRMVDPRKNVATLLRAFNDALPRMPRARLVVKAHDRPSPGAPRHRYFDRTAVLLGSWSDARMNALYQLSDFVGRAHHSEGWGLTLSDAILFERPIIAPAYSGNLEFMTARSAYLVRVREGLVGPRNIDPFRLRRPTMRWGYPDPLDVAHRLVQAYHDRHEPAYRRKVERALDFAKVFSLEAIRERVLVALEAAGRRARASKSRRRA